MIPALTATNPFMFTCPACVGKKSYEGIGVSGFGWDYKKPDRIFCKTCGQIFPDPKYPEHGKLVCPRMGQTLTYYINDTEKAVPVRDRTQYAYKWFADHTRSHVSFEGLVRYKKVMFMAQQGIRALAFAYAITGNPKYAKTISSILKRFAKVCKNWMYHDFYDTFADCDPLFAAWHYMNLPLEWKRNASAYAYGGHFETGDFEDTPKSARMLAALAKIKYKGPITAEMVPFSRLPNLVLPDMPLACVTAAKLKQILAMA